MLIFKSLNVFEQDLTYRLSFLIFLLFYRFSIIAHFIPIESQGTFDIGDLGINPVRRAVTFFGR